MAEKSNIDGVTITARGLQLITKLVAAESQMEFSSVKVGTGILAAGMNPYELTNLVQYKMDGMIAGYGYDEEAMDAYVVMQLSNNQVETGFVMTEVGLYAMDPDLGEILYGYLDLSNDPNYIMPAENGRSKTVQIKLHIIIGEVNEIKASINPLSQVTREELEKELEKRVSIQGGDTSETVVSVIEESTESFPVPMSGDKTKGLWGKLKKWQQDCLAKFGNYVLTSMITNQHLNDTNRVPTSALVYLMQQAITQLNMDLEGKSDASHYHDRVMVYNGYPHIAGISYITTDKFTIPKIIIDETVMDLIRNTTQTEAKINDIAIDWSTAPWRLKVNLWINGVTYTRYINFTN